VRFTPSGRLYIPGAVILVSLTLCAGKFGSLGAPSFLIPLAVAGVAYLLAVFELFRTPAFPKRVVVIGLLLSALWHLQFLRLPPGGDDDIHRYIWDGRVQRLGYNPYVVVPGDPALSRLHTAETRTLNNPDLPSPYPAGAELFFRAMTAIRESTFALKVAFVVCDFVIVFVLLGSLRLSGQGEHWVLAYAWHPLLATEVAGSGHVDILGALLLMLSFVALERRWRAAAALTFGLAVAVKLLPIVLLPLYWKRVRARDAVLTAIVVVLLYVPFLNHGRIPTGSLRTYVHSFWFNDPIFALLERVAAPELIAGLAVLVGILTAVWLRKKPHKTSDEFAWPMAASLICAPVVYPWYLLWLLPFLRSRSTLPILIWTVSILPTYYVWHLRALGHPFIVPGWILLLEYGSIAVTAAIISLRRNQGSGHADAVSN
jgi:alpha-1,6-mannosyltransferase